MNRNTPRPLAITALSLGLVAPAAVAQDDEQGQEAVTVQVQGEDAQRGPFAGELTLTDRGDGEVGVQRAVRFERSGAAAQQQGVGRVDAQGLQASLQAPEEGLADRLEADAERAQTDEVALQVSLDDQGSVQSRARSAQTRAQAQGTDEEGRLQAFFARIRAAVADFGDRIAGRVSGFASRVRGWLEGSSGASNERDGELVRDLPDHHPAIRRGLIDRPDDSTDGDAEASDAPYRYPPHHPAVRRGLVDEDEVARPEPSEGGLDYDPAMRR